MSDDNTHMKARAFRPVNVTAFVDWNSQIHILRPPRGISEEQLALEMLSRLGRLAGCVLTYGNNERRFNVALRLYHGWLHGFTVTPRRKALTTAIARTDFSSLSRNRNVLIRDEVGFGDRLLSALDSRLVETSGRHLTNTLRQSINDKTRLEEKMVDTALAADIVDLAYREPNEWILVFGNDDDLVPPLLVAEGIRPPNSGRIILVRTRPENKFLRLEGLRFEHDQQH